MNSPNDPGLHFTHSELEAISDAFDIAFGDEALDQSQTAMITMLREKFAQYAEGPEPEKPLKTLRQELREHQEATNCSDDQMVEILCGFIEKLDDDGQLEGPWYEWLFEWVTDHLHRAPGDVS